jgi:hypothetical protein
MSESRSVATHQQYLEALQKFDYFIAGLTGALSAYIAQNWKPQKTAHLGPETLELVALLLLFAAAVAGFKRIECTIATLRLNASWLHTLENRGAIAGAIQESEGRPMFNALTGEYLSPLDASQRYHALSEAAPELQKKLDRAATETNRWRNRLLVSGFAVLLTARFTALFW